MFTRGIKLASDSRNGGEAKITSEFTIDKGHYGIKWGMKQTTITNVKDTCFGQRLISIFNIL